MEICKVHMSSFRMLLTIVVGMFDERILNYPNNSMVLIMDSVGHFHNDIFGKCHRCFGMFDCYSNQICFILLLFYTKCKERKNEYNLIYSNYLK